MSIDLDAKKQEANSMDSFHDKPKPANSSKVSSSNLFLLITVLSAAAIYKSYRDTPTSECVEWNLEMDAVENELDVLLKEKQKQALFFKHKTMISLSEELIGHDNSCPNTKLLSDTYVESEMAHRQFSVMKKKYQESQNRYAALLANRPIIDCRRVRKFR